MVESGCNVTSEEVEKKLHSLKNYYIVTNNKIELSKQEPEYGVYEPTWVHFESLDFLKDSLSSKVTFDTMNGCGHDDSVESPVPKNLKRRRSKQLLQEKVVYEIE